MADQSPLAAPQRTPFPKGKYLGYAVAYGLGFLLMLLWQPNDLITREGIMLIGIFLPTLYMWVRGELLFSSMFAMAFLGMTGIIKSVDATGEVTRVFTHNNLWMEALGHFAVILLLTFMMIDHTLNETGVIKKIATWFITRKFIEGKPYAIMAMFIGGQIFVGLFMQNLALTALYLALTVKFCEAIGIKKGHSLWKCLFIAGLWGSNAVMISSPIAKFFPNFIIGLIRAIRPDDPIVISFAQYFALGIPFSILTFVAIMITIRIMKPDVTPLMKYSVAEFKKQDPPLGIRGKMVMAIFGTLLIVILAPDLIVAAAGGAAAPTVGFIGFMRTVSGWGPTLPAILTVFVLCLVRGEGRPLMDPQAALKSVPLPLLVFLGVAVFMGTPLGPGFASNLAPILGHLIRPLSTTLGPYMLVIVILVFASIITNFFSNAVIVNVGFALGIATFAVGDTIGPAAFLLMIGFASSAPSATPAAILQAAMYYGSGNVEPGDVIKHNVVYQVFAIIVALLMIPIVTTFIAF